MKVIIATVTISSALAALEFTPAFSQARGGGAAAGASGAATSAGAAGVSGAGTARAAGATGGSPTGNLAGRPGVPSALPGSTLNAPAGGAIATPGTATPIGPISSGVSAAPPAAVGRTFDRATIGGGPTDTIIDPASRQPVFRFPPASTLPQAVVTNTGGGAPFDSGLPDARTFPPGNPVGVGNTVGTNFGTIFTNAARQPIAVDLPPGAILITNRFGVTEAVVPPPVVVPVVPNSVGRGPTFESSSARTRQVPQRSAPPRNPSVVNPR